MAYDKVVDSAFLEAGLKKVGDSIRAKAGTNALLEFPDAMSAAVDAIDTSKPEQTKTATPSLSQQTISPDSGKVLSGVIINPITAALLTSLDPDFKEANIAEGVNMFGRIGTHKSGASVAYGTFTGTSQSTYTISGLSFAPQRVFIMLTLDGTLGQFATNIALYADTSGVKYGSASAWAAGTAVSTVVTPTFSNNSVALTAKYPSNSTAITFKSNYQYFWMAIG